MHDKLIMKARKDLVKLRGIPEEHIILKHIEAVTWPDASLGCSKEGRAYAQVVTPGYRILLSDGTTDFEYHTDTQRKVSLYAVANQRIDKGGAS